MESRESQRDKRVQDVIQGRPSGGGGSPTASAMRAREEIQGIEAERAANLERQKIIGATRQQQLATMKQAALLGASGMAAADGGTRVSPVAQQVAAMNPQTQAILQKYGVKPGPRSTTTTVQQSGPNIRTTNTTNNNVRNEIRIVQPQIPMRQQQIAIAPQGKAGNLDKFKAWLDSSFAKQANEYEIQQKEYRRREWNLARNSSKLFQKLSESTRSLGEKMDPRNMGSTFGGQLKTLLFLFLATTIDKWWNPLMKKIASFEAGFRTVFGLPVNADLERGGAEGLSFVNKIKEFIGIDTKTERGKATSLLGGIREVFSDGITRLIDTLKLFIEDRRIALQKINMPDFKLPNTDFNPLGNMINSAFKGVMAPATEYLGNILSALMSGSSAVLRKASNNVTSTAKNTFKHSYGGRYYTSESTDFMGNLKDDSTYGMSEMLTRNLATHDNVLRTGTLMTGLKMLEGNAQKSGGAVINPELLTRLGIGPDVISRMVQSGQAQYVPYKIIMVPKSEAESADYTGGSWGSYVGNEILDDMSFGIYGKLTGWGIKKAVPHSGYRAGVRSRQLGLGSGKLIAGAGKAVRAAGRWAGPLGWAATLGGGVFEGTRDYFKASRNNSSVVAKAVPESDPRPGTPIRLLKITPEGFNTIKSQRGIKSFDPTDRNFRTWLEGQERNQKAIMGVRGKMVYEDQAGMEALDKGYAVGGAYDAKLDEIRNRPGAWKDFSESMSNHFAAASQWVGSKINVMATGVSGNPSYARRNTIQNLYQALKTALDEKRRDLPEDKREAYARLMAAQAMHESSGNYPGGISKLAYEANNYGGVIATKNRPVYYLNNAKWSKFKDMQDWANFHVNLLDSGRYKIFDVDPSDYVGTLKRGGYFEDTESNYASGVQKHLGSINGVMGSYQYSSFNPTESMTAVTPPPTGAISLGVDMSGNNIKGCGPESVKDEKLKNILRSRNTGKFYSTSKGWCLLGYDDYKSLCTAGPSTFYEAGGYNLRGKYIWWNTGSPYSATSTQIGGTGLKKIWNGSLGQLDSMGPGQLRPGDIGILFGKHKDGSPSAHGMMWDGKHWVSDTIQSHGACYSIGRLGDQSAQIWRMPNFWPDDFGGGDEKESGTTYMDSNGEIYNGTFMGAAGNVAGQIIGSMGSAVTGMAQSLRGGNQSISGYNPAALSAAQKATIRWMKKNGAVEDESGIYIYDEATKTRSYLDPNSGISKTGNITRANIRVVAHMRDDGTIDSYETDTDAIDSYKDRAIGKLLNIQISEGKSPGSEVVDIYIGAVSDIDGFSDLAKKYLNYYRNRQMEYVLYEITSDGYEMSSILIPRIPMIDDNGKPIKLGKSKSSGITDPNEVKEDYYFDDMVYTGNRRHGWTFLYKKRGFKYKKLASDISDTVSDFHPYLHGELGIGLTPVAIRRVNAVLAYIRGELDNPKENLSWMNNGFGINKGDQEKLKKVHDAVIENGEKNLKATLEELGITEDSVERSRKDWESGKNKDNYITYINDKGQKEVLDATLGIKVASGDLKNPLRTLSVEDIMSQTGEEITNNIRRVDVLNGHMDVSDSAVIQRYFENETKDLKDPKIRREFFKRIAGKKRTQKIKGDNWNVIVGPDGKLRYSLDTKLGEEDGDFDKILAKYQDNISEVLGTDNKDKIRDLLVKGLSAETLNKLVGYNAGSTKGPNWSDADSIRYYYHGFEDIDTDQLMRLSKSNVAFKNSWLAENSMNRSLAGALAEKYNKNEGRDSEELFESNGFLMYRDANGMVHAQGTVTEEDGMKSAKAFDNSEEGASMYADVNEKLRQLNLGTQSGQALMEVEYATKYGAKRLGNGNMYIEKDGYRVVFNVNEVKDHASIKEILDKGTYYRNSESDSDEKNQEADNTFGENSGWSRIINEEGVELKGQNGASTAGHIGSDSDTWARNALREHMEETEKNISENDKKSSEFLENYRATVSGLQNERMSKMESNDVSKQIEGHAGNIEDYTKRSADYLRIIAGSSVEKDSDLEMEYLKLSAQELPKTQAEQRALGPVKNEDVDVITSEIKNSENAAISTYKNILLETAAANKGMSEKGIRDLAYARLLEELPGNKYTARFNSFGGWQRGLIKQGRSLQYTPEEKAKSDNVKAEGANIKEKEGIQKIEAKVVKTESDTAKQQEANAKKAEAIAKQQEANAEEERKQLERRAEMMSETKSHQLNPIGNISGGDVNYIQEGAHVTINNYFKNGFNPTSYTYGGSLSSK